MLALLVLISLISLGYSFERNFPLNELDAKHIRNIKTKLAEAKKVHTSHKRAQNDLPEALTNIENYFVTMKDCATVQGVGASLIVRYNGATVLKKVYGKSDRENDVNFTFDSLMSVGSVGKQMSAFVIGSLVDEGLLSYTDMISQHLPEWWSSFPGRRNALAGTIEDALSHRLGLTAYDMAWFANITSLPLSSLVHELENKFPVRNPVRAQWFYSNYGYVIVAAVAEKVTGKTWSQLVQERFIDRLGLTGKMFSTQREALQHSADYAYPYELTNELTVLPIIPREVNTIIDDSIQAAGAYTLSTNAMETYLTQLSLGLPTVVSAGNFDRSTSNFQSIWPNSIYISDFHFDMHGYSYGWIIGTYRGKRFHFHNGGTNGHSTMVFNFPDDQISISAFINIDSIDLGTYLFLNLYVYDQLLGFDSIITPDIVCYVSQAYFNNVPSAFNNLSTTVVDGDKLVGTYYHELFKNIVISLNSDGSYSAALGSVSGKLRSQNGATFTWFLENNWSLLGFEMTFSQRNSKRDLSTSKYDIVGVNLGWPEGASALVNFARVN